MRRKRSTVFISSPTRSVERHFAEAKEACLRLGLKPLYTEMFAAGDDLGAELEERIRNADLFLAILGFDYGHILPGSDVSLVEREIDLGRAHHKEIVVFLMNDEHPITPAMIDRGEPGLKLQELREQLTGTGKINYFHSLRDFRDRMLQALSSFQTRAPEELRYEIAIPEPPAPYIAHAYPLLPRTGFVGRRSDLKFLDDWVLDPAAPHAHAAVLSIIAIGGMGKSALTWHWFDQHVPENLPDLDGAIWWSFYERDATFESFVARTLAYTRRTSEDDVRAVYRSAESRREALYQALQAGRYLIVLDGLERILNAYSQADVSRLADWEIAEQTGQLEDSTGHVSTESIGRHYRRLTQEPHAGAFLRRLARLTRSKILISTRLDVADLRDATSEPLAGTHPYFLGGLDPEDSLELWRTMGLRGSPDRLNATFKSFAYYPLLIRLLAGEVAEFRRRPGDFDAWSDSHPGFDPAHFDGKLRNLQSHILDFAVRDLDRYAWQVLEYIAAFSEPASYDTLEALLVGEGRPMEARDELDDILTGLEDRGLIGWDRRANRYDMHPVVRGIVLRRSSSEARHTIYEDLRAFFASIRELRIESLEDLTPVMEEFNSMVCLGQYETALELYRSTLHDFLRYDFGAYRQAGELLQSLLPDTGGGLWECRSRDDRSYALCALAEMHNLTGRTDESARLLENARSLYEKGEADAILCKILSLLAFNHFEMGSMRRAEEAALAGIELSRALNEQHYEGVCLFYQLQHLCLRGERAELERIGGDSVAYLRYIGQRGSAYSLEYRIALVEGDYETAREATNRQFELLESKGGRNDAAVNQGWAALKRGDLEAAQERFVVALSGARESNHLHREIESLNGLATTHLERGRLEEARELTDAALELLSRTRDVIEEADLRNVRARLAIAEDNVELAAHDARAAYKASWCDGPPYAYAEGLEEALKTMTLLRGLGVKADEPTLRPFDPAEHNALPALEVHLPAAPGLPEGISDTTGWSQEDVERKLEEVRESLDWTNTTGSARKWWEAFESENAHRMALVLRLAEELAHRGATITEFFLSYVYSNTDNIQANLHYLDYQSMKKREETKKKAGEPASVLPEAGGIGELTEVELCNRLEALMADAGWEQTTESALKWWKAFEDQSTRAQVLHILQALHTRKATINELYLAYVYSNTESLQAVLHYLDYSRLKKREDERHKALKKTGDG